MILRCARRKNWRGKEKPPKRAQGAALLTVLLIIALLTIFVTQVFFYTGVDLQAVANHRDSLRARALALASLRGVQEGLNLDEVIFFSALGRLKSLLDVAPAPLEEGFLLSLQIQPIDHLFNLNALVNTRPNTDQDLVHWRIFLNTFSDARPTAQGEEVDESTRITEPLSDAAISAIYAALVDWVDPDSLAYTAPDGATGGEGDNPLEQRPEVQVKNAPFDVLEEIRLVRGVVESRLPWSIWPEHTLAWTRRENAPLYLGRININLASAEEITRHLENRRLPERLSEAANQAIQQGVGRYIDQAETLARAFAPLPGQGERRVFTDQTLNTFLRDQGFNDNYGANYLFSTRNQRYLVRLQTEVGKTTASLQALLYVPRNAQTRVATRVEVLQIFVR